jgi:hypothetical protein
MLPELTEQEATGHIAQIYQEMRTLCAVPYVSSLQRHLARPSKMPCRPSRACCKWSSFSSG